MRRATLFALFTVILGSVCSYNGPLSQVTAATGGALPAVLQTDGRLGFCDVLPDSWFPRAVPWSQLAFDAGARMNRWEFRWDRIEHTQGIFDWTADDEAVHSSLNRGMQVLGILIATPEWASVTPWTAGNSVPAGLYLPYQSQDNLWAAYVRATVEHFAGRVHVWEVWNEPDLPSFWNGSVGDYVRLLKVAYLAAHQVDSSVRIVMGGMAASDMSFFRSVLSGLVNDPTAGSEHDFFDIAAWHAYSSPIDNYVNLENMRSYLRSQGLSRPIWVTETGLPSDTPGGSAEQAAFTVESIAYAFAAGAERVFVYRFTDYDETRPWGLVQNSGAPRPAYIAFQLAARYFANLRDGVLSSDGPVQRLVLYRPGTRLTLLWNDVNPPTNAGIWNDGTPGTILHLSGATSATASTPGMIWPKPAPFEPVMILSRNTPPQHAQQVNVPLTEATGSRVMALSLAAATGTVALGRYAVGIAPSGVAALDPALALGDGYTGAAALHTNVPLLTQVVLHGVPLSPAGRWRSLALAPHEQVTLVNANSSATSVVLTVDGRSRQSLSLGPNEETVWDSPSAKDAVAKLWSSQPVQVDQSAMSVAQPSTHWYALGSHRALLYNPAKRRDKVTLEFGTQRRSVTLRRHAVRIVSLPGTAQVIARRPVIAAVQTASGWQGAVTGAATRWASFTNGAKRLTLYNPSSAQASSTVRFVTGPRTIEQTPSVPVGQSLSLPIPAGVKAIIGSSSQPLAVGAQ